MLGIAEAEFLGIGFDGDHDCGVVGFGFVIEESF